MPSTPFSFAFVSNSAVVAEKVQAYAQEHGWPLEEVRLATMEEALPVARRLFAQGVDVILGGGGTGKLLRRHHLPQPHVHPAGPDGSPRIHGQCGRDLL